MCVCPPFFVDDNGKKVLHIIIYYMHRRMLMVAGSETAPYIACGWEVVG